MYSDGKERWFDSDVERREVERWFGYFVDRAEERIYKLLQRAGEES